MTHMTPMVRMAMTLAGPRPVEVDLALEPCRERFPGPGCGGGAHYRVLLQPRDRRLNGLFLGHLWRSYAPGSAEPHYYAGQELQQWLQRQTGNCDCDGSLEECRAVLEAAGRAGRRTKAEGGRNGS